MHLNVRLYYFLRFLWGEDQQSYWSISTFPSYQIFPVFEVGEAFEGKACFWLIGVMCSDEGTALASCSRSHMRFLNNDYLLEASFCQMKCQAGSIDSSSNNHTF